MKKAGRKTPVIKKATKIPTIRAQVASRVRRLALGPEETTKASILVVTVLLGQASAKPRNSKPCFPYNGHGAASAKR